MGFFDIFKKKKKIVPKGVVHTHKYKVRPALTLSGGATRGFGHLGVLKAFEEEGIEFDIVTGTSAGSMVGALYSFGFTYNEIYEIASKIKTKDIKPGKILLLPSSAGTIESLLKKAMGDIVFSDLKRKFSAVAVDLVSGDEFVMNSGSVCKAVSASCCVPAVFKPVIWEDKHLVDGGLLNPMPSDVARDMGADVVISVDINSKRGGGTDSTKLFDVIGAFIRITSKAAASKGIYNSNIIIEPDLNRFKATSLEGMDEMIAEGYRATKEKMSEIKELLGIN